MIRVLTMIAVAGFVLMLASFTAAVALGGPDAINRGGWNIASQWGGDWDWDDDDWDHDATEQSGPQATRTLEWSGADRLDVELPADVHYIQAEGPPTLTVTGSARSVERVEIRGDTLRFERGRRRWGRKVDVVLRAPNVSTFEISGRSHLIIENYNQPKLVLRSSGDVDIRATGQTDALDLDMSGAGDADLGGLKTKGAEVDISGAADAVIAPTEWAEIDISGAGDVRLLTHPPRLNSDVSGSGSVHFDETEGSESPSPSPSPTPSPSPSPPAKPAKT